MKETIQLLGYPHFWQPPYVWGPRSCSSELTNLSTEAPSDVGGSARPALRPLLYAMERRGGAVDWKQNIHFTSCGNMWYYVVIFHQGIAGHRDVLIQKHVNTKQETKIGTPNTVCRWWKQPILACLIMESLQRSYWRWIRVNTPDSWNVPKKIQKGWFPVRNFLQQQHVSQVLIWSFHLFLRSPCAKPNQSHQPWQRGVFTARYVHPIWEIPNGIPHGSFLPIDHILSYWNGHVDFGLYRYIISYTPFSDTS